MEFAHRSVLLNECIDALAIKPDGIYLDGTLGGAGHSLQICRNLTTGRLIGVDRDLVALEAAKMRLYRHAKKVTLVHDNFENVGAILTALGLDRIDGMLFDLGVSSPQLDDAERGFSYMADAPLDMRMDRDQLPYPGRAAPIRRSFQRGHVHRAGRPRGDLGQRVYALVQKHRSMCEFHQKPSSSITAARFSGVSVCCSSSS